MAEGPTASLATIRQCCHGGKCIKDRSSRLSDMYAFAGLWSLDLGSQPMLQVSSTRCVRLLVQSEVVQSQGTKTLMLKVAVCACITEEEVLIQCNHQASSSNDCRGDPPLNLDAWSVHQA